MLAVTRRDDDHVIGFARIAPGTPARAPWSAKLGYASTPTTGDAATPRTPPGCCSTSPSARSRLHRVTAAIGPENEASIAVVEAARLQLRRPLPRPRVHQRCLARLLALLDPATSEYADRSPGRSSGALTCILSGLPAGCRRMQQLPAVGRHRRTGSDPGSAGGVAARTDPGRRAARRGLRRGRGRRDAKRPPLPRRTRVVVIRSWCTWWAIITCTAGTATTRSTTSRSWRSAGRSSGWTGWRSPSTATSGTPTRAQRPSTPRC